MPLGILAVRKMWTCKFFHANVIEIYSKYNPDLYLENGCLKDKLAIVRSVSKERIHFYIGLLHKTIKLNEYIPNVMCAGPVYVETCLTCGDSLIKMQFNKDQ